MLDKKVGCALDASDHLLWWLPCEKYILPAFWFLLSGTLLGKRF